MEVVYLLISFIEIVLTIYLLSLIIKAKTKAEEIEIEFNKEFKIFYENFSKFKKTLKLIIKGMEIAKTASDLDKHLKFFKKIKNTTLLIAWLYCFKYKDFKLFKKFKKFFL